jgi:hypothetical protein
MSDQNCLLSYLWGRGSSPVTIDLEASKRKLQSTKLQNSRLQANIFIKAMCGGGPEWGTPSKTIEIVPRMPAGLPEEVVNFAHLSVNPKELAEAKGLRADGCQLLYFFEKKKALPLPLGTLIFTSIQKAEDYEEIVQAIRGNTDYPKIVFTNDSNVGPRKAMRNIFVQAAPDNRKALGNLPLYCNKTSKEKWIVPQQVRLYKRTLSSPVFEALQRRKKLREALKGMSTGGTFLSVCPYMENFMASDWFSVLEQHLYRVNCAYELKDGFRLNMYSPWKVQEELRKLIDLKFTAPTTDGIWYEEWLESYVTSTDGIKGKYKGLKKNMVQKHFREIRGRARSAIPLRFLLQKKLVDCL